MNNLTIIIVTYQSAAIIESCLNKIDFTQNKVFVVDNNSSDSTTKIIAERFPQIELIKLEQNIGYGRGNNIGLAKTKTDYALILNPDAIIDEKVIEKILAVMDKKPDVALAAPLLLNKNEDREKALKIVAANSVGQIGGYPIVKYVIGAAVFLRMEVFRKIGFYDQEIFMFYEDDEICARVIKNGYKNMIITDAFAFHGDGKSSKKTLRIIYKRQWHKAWSKLLWKRRNKGWKGVIKSAPRLIIQKFIGAIFYFLILDWQSAIANFASMSGYISFAIGLKAFKKDGRSRA